MNNILISDMLTNVTVPLLSLEFYPPKDNVGFGILGSSIERIREINPDFVSVTYGAGGSTQDRSLDACELLQRMGLNPIMPHLTCVGASRRELQQIADQFYAHGFRNIMTLRGDPPQGADRFSPRPDGIPYAKDLVRLLKVWHPDICCGVAGYPETHPEAESGDTDITHLKAKLDAGAAFVTTQLFFDNKYYFDFVEHCRNAGIQQPIIPGLLPAISLKQAERVISLCSASFPDELATAMANAGGQGPKAEEIGMHWLVKQIDELLEHGAPGIHLYILNRAKTALSPILKECLSRWRY